MSRKTHLSKSHIHGQGTFAKRSLKKGEIAFIAKGKRINFIVKNKADALVGPNWMSIGRDLYLDPREDNPLTFLNHSCNPNLGVRGSVTYVALKNIRAGEELTVDYSTIELSPLWRMKCKCGSKNCRKIIGSVHSLSEKSYKKMSSFIPRYVAWVYNKAHTGQKNG